MGDFPNRLIDLGDVTTRSNPATNGYVPVWNSTTKTWDWDLPTPKDSTVTAAKVGAGLKPSGSAVDATEALRALGKTAGLAAGGVDTEYAFSSWSAPAPWHAQVAAGGVAAFTNLILLQSVVALNTAASGFTAMYIDPADLPGGSRTVKVRVRAKALVGSSTGPGVTFTFGLYPVATWIAAGVNVRSGVATLGTVVCSTTIASPTGQHHAESAEATLSSADWYVLVVSTGGTTAANSQTDYGIQLQLRRT